ncbi:hypothetical protein IEQ34_000981 [Dendrobium chrysotoxum]|uniref:Uncharacterized protein n=1 Tax=Dendrobium chrysotoxum TaxID=161865 RepID=A0AAV7HMX5_DENCH|nr:hypothetical protein IEQ34_000981 [Dendrobium chrysotoxum]
MSVTDTAECFYFSREAFVGEEEFFIFMGEDSFHSHGKLRAVDGSGSAGSDYVLVAEIVRRRHDRLPLIISPARSFPDQLALRLS